MVARDALAKKLESKKGLPKFMACTSIQIFMVSQGCCSQTFKTMEGQVLYQAPSVVVQSNPDSSRRLGQKITFAGLISHVNFLPQRAHNLRENIL